MTAGYTRREWRWIVLAALTLVPFALVRFVGVGQGAPPVVAATTGLAIIAAAFALSWGVEGLETVVPQTVALAILALIEVAPEYTFEAILAYRQQTELAAASMTGANRLPLGFGWPLIVLVAFFGARRRGQSLREIGLDRRNATEVFFLLVASLYAFVIVVKASLTLVDAAVLLLIYAAYILVGWRVAANEDDKEQDEDEDEGGVAGRTKALRGGRKVLAIGGFLVFGTFVLYFGAEPFIDAILQVAREVGVSEFILIQWVAPFLSEFPESLTAYLWAAGVVLAAKGLSNLISSKLNQWTLLIAAIPIAYSIGRREVSTLHLTPLSADELFLTAAQSLFGVALLLTLRLGLREAILLLVLFLAQFFMAVESIRMIIGWVYLALAAGYLAVHRRELRLCAELRTVFLTGGGGGDARPNTGQTTKSIQRE